MLSLGFLCFLNVRYTESEIGTCHYSKRDIEIVDVGGEQAQHEPRSCNQRAHDRDEAAAVPIGQSAGDRTYKIKK